MLHLAAFFHASAPPRAQIVGQFTGKIEIDLGGHFLSIIARIHFYYEENQAESMTDRNKLELLVRGACQEKRSSY